MDNQNNNSQDPSTSGSGSIPPLTSKSLKEIQQEKKTGGVPVDSGLPPLGTEPQVNGQVGSIQGKSLTEIQAEKLIANNTQNSTGVQSTESQMSNASNLAGTVTPENSQKDSEAPVPSNEPKSTLPPLEDVSKAERKRRGMSVPNPFKVLGSIRKTISLGCFVLILLIIALVLIIVFKPAFAWNPIKSFLNGSYEEPGITEVTHEGVKQYIDEAITDLDNSYTLSESQATILFNNQFSTNIQIDFEPDIMRLIYDIDKNPDNPLWVMIDLGKNSDGSLEVKRIGFDRVSLPSSVNRFISNYTFKAMNLVQGNFKDQTSISALSIFTDAPSASSITTQDISFENDQVRISFEKN